MGTRRFWYAVTDRTSRQFPACAASGAHGRDTGCRSGRRPYSRRHAVPGYGNAPGPACPPSCQIVILVDQAHIQAHGAGLAVVAVGADPLGRAGSHPAQHRVIPLGRRRLKKAQQRFQVPAVTHPGQHRHHARPVQRILQTLVPGQRQTKGRPRRVQQLAGGKGLHHRDAHALGLAAAVERHPLVQAAQAVLPFLVVVGRVDAEHQHVQQAVVQHLGRHRRGVGAHADVAHHALPFQLLQVVDGAGLPGLAVVLRLVNAVEEPEVDVVGFQLGQLPVHRPLDGVQIQRPAVFPGEILGTEMDLEKDLVPHAGARNGIAVCRKGCRVGRGHVKVVDAVFQRQGDGGLHFPVACLTNGAGPKPQHADLFAAVGQCAVLHPKTSCLYPVKIWPRRNSPARPFRFLLYRGGGPGVKYLLAMVRHSREVYPHWPSAGILKSGRSLRSSPEA